MGASESILATEISKPADASDINFNDPNEAQAEVIRIRKLMAEFGGPESGKLRASALGIKSTRGSVWSSARRSHRKKVVPEFSKSFDPETSVSRQENDENDKNGITVTEMIRHSAQVIRELREKLSLTQTQLSDEKRHLEENAILLVSTQQSLEKEREINVRMSEEIDNLKNQNNKLDKEINNSQKTIIKLNVELDNKKAQEESSTKQHETTATITSENKLSNVRLKEEEKESKSMKQEVSSDIVDPLKVGEKIEARPNGSIKFYAGVISLVNAGSPETYNIDYDDGDKETKVKRLRIRREGERQKREVEVGTKIEARFGGGKALFDGVILKNNGDNTYEIKYDDGDVEKAVKRDMIEALCYPKSNTPPKSTSSNVPVVDKPIVNSKKETDIMKIFNKFDSRKQNRWSLFDWDEFQVSLGEPSFTNEGNDLASLCEMLQVESDPQGRTTGLDALVKYYELEAGDLVEDIKKLKLDQIDTSSSSSSDNNNNSSSSSSEMNKTESTAQYKIGDVVESRYKGGPDFYPGKIKNVNKNKGKGNHDISYDVVYDDGDMENDLNPLRIRLKGMKQKRDLILNERIEARYGGGQQLFTGNIITLNDDGKTYGIRYDDGDKEMKVARNLIVGQWH